MSCGTCNFGLRRGKRLECHFYPPDVDNPFGWPVVGLAEYCGQYLQRLTPGFQQEAVDRPKAGDEGGLRANGARDAPGDAPPS